MTSDIDDSKAPLLEHLIELRTRLIRSAAVLLIAFFACFYVASDIFEFLVQKYVWMTSFAFSMCLLVKF